MINQNAMPCDILPVLERFNIPQTTLAAYSGIPQPRLSQWANGKQGLSIDAQLAVFKALRFFRWAAAQTDLPVDFSNVAALKPYWERFLALELEADVIRLDGELAGKT